MIKSDSTIQLPILIQPLDLWRSTFTNEAFFLRFGKVSKSLPLSEPTFCAPISKPTTPGSWGSLSRPHFVAVWHHILALLQGVHGGSLAMGMIVFWFVWCASLVGEDEPYSVRFEHSRIVSCFQSGVDRSPIQPTWAVMVQWPKSMLGLADVGYKQE